MQYWGKIIGVAVALLMGGGFWGVVLGLLIGHNELLTKEFFIIVENGIDTLPPKCKQIFVMKSRKSLSNSEISNLLGLSLRTVENQVYIARNVLRKYIDSYLCS